MSGCWSIRRKPRDQGEAPNMFGKYFVRSAIIMDAGAGLLFNLGVMALASWGKFVAG
jgi:hypothetical protein